MNPTLIYVHDPMCSWCWGFRYTMDALESALPENITVKRILGGLAPDSDEPMPASMQNMLQQTWQQIASVIPGTQFNMDFWTENKPRRSTWPSCRAVIAARAQSPSLEVPMIHAIQEAYYLNAQNPSDVDVLASLATRLGCDEESFRQTINSENTRNDLQQEMQFGQQLGVRGFPSLVFVTENNQAHGIRVDYNSANSMLDQIEQINLN